MTDISEKTQKAIWAFIREYDCDPSASERIIEIIELEAARERQAREAVLEPQPPIGKTYTIEHDGFTGQVIGHYTTLEGKRGVVLQQIGTRVVHVYGEKWLK